MRITNTTSSQVSAPSKAGSARKAWMSAAVSFTHLLNVGDDEKQYAGYTGAFAETADVMAFCSSAILANEGRGYAPREMSWRQGAGHR